jgi:hypothetical protein
MRRRRLTVYVWVGAILIGGLIGSSFSTHADPVKAYQGGNLLQNPGFEEPYITLNSDPTLRVANGWQPWSLPQGSSSSINARPEYKPAPSNRVHSGNAPNSASVYSSMSGRRQASATLMSAKTRMM